MAHRHAALLALVAAAAPVLAQTGGAQPAAVEEKEPTTIDAERIEGVGELDVTARGNAEIKQDDLNIFGDVLRYNREFGRIEGDGGVRLNLGIERFFGPQLRYNVLDDTGRFDQPTFILRGDDAPGRGTAESLEFRGKDHYRFKNAIYTTCEPGRNDWVVEANQLDLDYEASEGVARGARLKFFDTTVLASPFAMFPLDKTRKSGFLSPYYGHNTRRGTEFGLPYYWNIAPERDLTVTPIYMTKRGLNIKNELRYFDRGYSGEAKIEYLPGDKSFGNSRQGVTWQHYQNLLPNLRYQIDYNRVSDDRFFVDLGGNVRQTSNGVLNQEAIVNYGSSILGLGYGAQARIQRFQTLQDPLAPITPPYQRIPQLNFNTAKNDIGGLVDASLPIEFVHFTHPTFVRGSRVVMNPTFAAPKLSPGWFVTPKAGLFFSNYSLNQVAPGESTAPRNSIPWFSMDSGLIFDRDARWFGENLTQTLEPRAYYVYVPYRNQDKNPLFDTGLADLNFPQLFTENRFGGYDRFGDANQVTLAMTSRFLANNGQEAFRATLGQRFHFTSERVTQPGVAPRAANTSDVLASIGGRLFRYWTFDTTAEYDPHNHRAQRYNASVRYAPELAKVITASYRFNRDTIRQIDIAAQWPVSQGWYLVGRYNYSLLDKTLLEGIFGLEYNAGCWVLRVVAQRVQAAAQVSSMGFFVFLELNGIGELGTDEAVQLLKRNVPGYTVTNPGNQFLVPPSARPRLPFPMVY